MLPFQGTEPPFSEIPVLRGISPLKIWNLDAALCFQFMPPELFTLASRVADPMCSVSVVRSKLAAAQTALVAYRSV